MQRPSKTTGPRPSLPGSTPQNRWYPNRTHVDSPAAVMNTLRVVLDQFYDLQDRHAALQKQVAEAKSPSAPPQPSSPFPPGSGPADSKLLGLNVEPVDVDSLANGASLKFNKSSGTFKFS